MGTWKTERGRGSDAMADILGKAVKEIGELPEGMTLLDLADAIEFVMLGRLTVEFAPGVSTSPLTLKYMNDNIDKYHAFPNRGQVVEQDDDGA